MHSFHSTSPLCRFCCIAPVIAAQLLPGVELTVGMSKDNNGCWPYAGTAASIEAMGATHIDKDVTVSLTKWQDFIHMYTHFYTQSLVLECGSVVEEQV